jgi:hypothetical protein
MTTGRPDFDAMVKFSSIPVDEPKFILRAQDACAADAVRAWAELAKSAGTPLAVVEQALHQADRMEAWPIKKVADADHLTPDEAKNLVADHKRRLWNLGAMTPEAIAERRGRRDAAEILNSADALAALSLLEFESAPIAELFRATGHVIPAGPAQEQAYVLRWILQLVIEYGPDWRGAAADEMRRRRALLGHAEVA